jgi:hypothetical protein
MTKGSDISVLYREFADALTEVLAENAVGPARRGRLARARAAVKHHPDYSEAGYLREVERKDEGRNYGLGPEHDWSSHAADAFGYLSISYEEPPAAKSEKRARESRPQGVHSGRHNSKFLKRRSVADRRHRAGHIGVHEQLSWLPG